MEDMVELVIDYPSKIAEALLNDEIDIGLVPVAIIPEMIDYHIVSDYCISSDGAVESVGIFSEVPIEDIKVVLLDYQSKTSIQLARILLRDHWNINPVFENAGLDFREKITGNTAAVVIGDRAFEQAKTSKYHYDLGLAWKNMTGLPFVFAAWVSNKPMNEFFIDRFNEANSFGLQHIDEVVSENPYPLFDLKQYYTQNIQYKLDSYKRGGMNEFLGKIKQKTGEEIAFFK